MNTRMTIIVAATVVLHCVTAAQAYLHPQMGRFMQRDPLGYVVSNNLFEYMRGRPHMNRDPSGLRDADCSIACDACAGLPDSRNAINSLVNLVLNSVNRSQPGLGRGQLLRDVIAGEVPGTWPVSNSWIEDQLNNGKQVVTNPRKLNNSIAQAPCMFIKCNEQSFCIGTDKLGHFFQQGYMLYEIASTPGLGDEYARQFSRWTEGYYGGSVNPTIDAWLRWGMFKFHGYGKKDPADFHNLWGGRWYADPSSGDIAANMAGLDFWKDFMGGKYDAGGFDICAYLHKGFEDPYDPDRLKRAQNSMRGFMTK